VGKTLPLRIAAPIHLVQGHIADHVEPLALLVREVVALIGTRVAPAETGAADLRKMGLVVAVKCAAGVMLE
jgi:hypothetical protein